MLAVARIMFRQRKPHLWKLLDANEVCWTSVIDRLNSHPEEARWVSQLDGHQNTFLHRALIKHGSHLPLEVVEKVITCYPKVLRCRNGFGRTPLHLAVENNGRDYVSIAIVLLILRAYPEAAFKRTIRGYLPIHYALACKSIESLHTSYTLLPSPSTLIAYHMLTNRNIMVAKLLLDVYPSSVRKSYPKQPKNCARHQDLLATIFNLWRCKYVCQSCFYANLCKLTDITIRYLFISLYGRKVTFRPLHVLLMDKKYRLLENIRLRHYLLVERYPNELAIMDHRQRLCLHVAIKNRYTWTTGIKEIHEGERRATETPDRQGLLPFMIAGIHSDIDTTYKLLRENPSILKGFGTKCWYH